MKMNYTNTADELSVRFEKILKSNPKLMDEKDPFKFFDHGLNMKGIEPTYAQACWALSHAKNNIKNGKS